MKTLEMDIPIPLGSLRFDTEKTLKIERGKTRTESNKILLR